MHYTNIHTFILFWFRKTSVTVETQQLSFLCAFHLEISSEFPLFIPIYALHTNTSILFWFRKTSVLVETYQLSFCVLFVPPIRRSLHFFSKFFFPPFFHYTYTYLFSSDLENTCDCLNVSVGLPRVYLCLWTGDSSIFWVKSFTLLIPNFYFIYIPLVFWNPDFNAAFTRAYIYTYIYSHLTEKIICDYRNVSVTLPCFIRPFHQRSLNFIDKFPPFYWHFCTTRFLCISCLHGRGDEKCN